MAGSPFLHPKVQELTRAVSGAFRTRQAPSDLTRMNARQPEGTAHSNHPNRLARWRADGDCTRGDRRLAAGRQLVRPGKRGIDLGTGALPSQTGAGPIVGGNADCVEIADVANRA